MIVLLTRPAPDNETSAALLRARGYQVALAPLLRFEPVALAGEPGRDYGAVIVTSANALRGLASWPVPAEIRKLPLFAVGDRTAAAARDAGFATVISAGGDAGDLRAAILAARSKDFDRSRPLLYLAGADLSRDLAAELSAAGLAVVTVTTYRMTPVSGLPPDIGSGFAAHEIGAVLHYSRRSARAFVEAVRREGVEISALAVLQCCLSPAVAEVLREAGATQLAVAAAPDEKSLVEALSRALTSISR